MVGVDFKINMATCFCFSSIFLCYAGVWGDKIGMIKCPFILKLGVTT